MNDQCQCTCDDCPEHEEDDACYNKATQTLSFMHGMTGKLEYYGFCVKCANHVNYPLNQIPVEEELCPT